MSSNYTAAQIEVLEGLEPVRRRPGMYIGGTDDRAMHHLVWEVLDNSMDEAVAGFASKIQITLHDANTITIEDNGRGIPIDPHPSDPDKSALEVILTKLHAGGKFSNKVYHTAGGLHGVGISVVNALSSDLKIEVWREKQGYEQHYSRGHASDKITKTGKANKRGTRVTFTPDPQIFERNTGFKPARIYKIAKSKAYLFKGVEITWSCAPELIKDGNVPETDSFHFPNGVADYVERAISSDDRLFPTVFSGHVDFDQNKGKVDYALVWVEDRTAGTLSYCNTIPTLQGGTHETGLRAALTKSIKQYAEMVGEKKGAELTADDICGSVYAVLSVFIPDPQFQGQTKDRLGNTYVSRLVEQALRDRLDNWLAQDADRAKGILAIAIDRAEERKRSRLKKATSRKSTMKKLRLPGKLTDCARKTAEGTEIFIVEGDSAGGSAKQGRDRQTQAILPLRGKILNVMSATEAKIMQNQEIQDLILALGCGIGRDCDTSDLRYEKVIIMTDADVDGAHIAALLITFFYKEMHAIIEDGRLFLAQPPLYRLSGGGKTAYAIDDDHLEKLKSTTFKGLKKIDISRFKGLGEMPAKQLKETTMDAATRKLIRITMREAAGATALLDDHNEESENGDVTQISVDQLIQDLMGKNAEARYNFIQANAQFAADLDV